MVVIGVVGPIGAGKTAVLRFLEQLGARTVAADELSREVLAPGQPALQLIREAFGDQYFDAEGHLIRKALGNRIFSDEAARRRLDDLVHPLMTRLLAERLAQWREAGVAVAVVESAVLEEMGALGLVDRLLLVTAPESVRLQRLQERDHLSEEEAARRVSAHERLELEAAQADFRLDNGGSLESLRRQVEQLWPRLVGCC
jgi:dephospho-CoA kinase